MTSFLPNKQQIAFRKGTIKIRTQPQYELWLKTTLEIFWGKILVNQHRYIKCSNMSLLRVRKQQEILTSFTINIQMKKRKKRVPRPHPWSTYIDPTCYDPCILSSRLRSHVNVAILILLDPKPINHENHMLPHSISFWALAQKHLKPTCSYHHGHVHRPTNLHPTHSIFTITSISCPKNPTPMPKYPDKCVYCFSILRWLRSSEIAYKILSHMNKNHKKVTQDVAPNARDTS